MPKTYHHLTKEERDLIAVLKGNGTSLRDIARSLGRNPGTISRELRRNAPPIHRSYYLSHRAHARYVERNRTRAQRLRCKGLCVRRYVRERVTAGWSPELTAGRWSRLHPERSISHEAIYQWIYAEERTLIPYLVRSHKKRQRRGYSRKHQKTHIPSRISITKRPKEATRRMVAGHWEADTAVSRQSTAALQVATERKTRLAKLSKLKRKGAHEMRVALTRRLSRCPKRLRKTITYDNGSENTDHEATNAVLGTRSYFCTPYHSWEKGTVENTIGLVRRSLPKKTDFAIVSSKDLRKIEYRLNHRPRKCLNYRTPAEAYRMECCT